MSIDFTIATCQHRLDQFTSPSFDRQTVEALIAEIHELRSRPRVAPHELTEHLASLEADLAHRDRLIALQQQALARQADQLHQLVEQLIAARKFGPVGPPLARTLAYAALQPLGLHQITSSHGLLTCAACGTKVVPGDFHDCGQGASG